MYDYLSLIIVGIVVIVMFIILMTLGLMLFKRLNPSIELEDELGIGHIYLNSDDLQYLVGKDGVAVTDIKPSGKCKIDGIEFDVKAESGFIPSGTKVRISRIQGNRIMAREI